MTVLTRLIRLGVALLAMGLALPAFAARAEGGTMALAQALRTPHSCTAMVQTAGQALVVCQFPGRHPAQFHTTAAWLRAHFQPVPDVSGLYQSDAPATAARVPVLQE